MLRRDDACHVPLTTPLRLRLALVELLELLVVVVVLMIRLRT